MTVVLFIKPLIHPFILFILSVANYISLDYSRCLKNVHKRVKCPGLLGWGQMVCAFIYTETYVLIRSIKYSYVIRIATTYWLQAYES